MQSGVLPFFSPQPSMDGEIQSETILKRTTWKRVNMNNNNRNRVARKVIKSRSHPFTFQWKLVLICLWQMHSSLVAQSYWVTRSFHHQSIHRKRQQHHRLSFSFFVFLCRLLWNVGVVQQMEMRNNWLVEQFLQYNNNRGVEKRRIFL